ncbi:MAG: beta strand repeat-containing protein [Desulfamplus sp.]
MPFTVNNDLNILQASDNQNVSAGLGNDIYVVANNQLSQNQTVTVTDLQGVSTIRLIGGLAIKDAQLSSTTLRLTLSNDAEVTILSADKFSFGVGGDSFGVGETTQTFAQFATNTLGLSGLPSTGSSTVSNVTIPGGSTAINTTFTLLAPEGTVIEHAPVVMWGYAPDGQEDNDEEHEGGIPAAELINFLVNIAGVDFYELGLIDDDGVDPTTALENISNITIGDITSADGGPVDITITTLDGQVLTAEASLGNDYLIGFLRDLIFDEENNSRLYLAQEEDEVIAGDPIVLTTTQNNGNTVESGFTSSANDLIVAGRLDILHEAYIDAGGGYNTLEVDAKGVYAQPLRLANIQEISVQNLPNVYGDTSPGEWQGVAGAGSIFDISRATELERLVITEGWETGVVLGELTIVGIRNAAVARFEGGFTQDVNLHYGRGLAGELNIELAVGDVDAGFSIVHNAAVLNVDSQGIENHLHLFNAGDVNSSLSRINVTGTGVFAVDEDLAPSFNAGRPAIIDASANTGGIDVTLTGHDNVTITGTAANDEIIATESGTVTIAAGNGNNVIDVSESEVAYVTSGTGNDTITAEDVVKDDGTGVVVINAGDGNNVIKANGSDNVAITTGTGSDLIQAMNCITANINASDGNNTIAAGAEELTITTGAGNDAVYVFGTVATGDVADGSVLNIDLGAGTNTLQLGYPNFPDPDGDPGDVIDLSVTALEGSTITGENIKIVVGVTSDISNADISGVTSVQLTDEQVLTITDDQLGAIGVGNFTVLNAAAGNTAVLNIIVDEDATLSDIVALASLNKSIKLNIDIRDGATFTLTAEELHKYIAVDGIDASDGLNGKVVITNAGLNFDAFAGGEDLDDGDADDLYYGTPLCGSLSDDFDGSDDVTIIRSTTGFERPIPGDSTDTLTIDSDVTPSVETAIVSEAVTLKIVGDSDISFTYPVDLGRDAAAPNIANGGKGDLGAPETDAFTIDFSALTGNLTNLTIANFQDVKQIKGNGSDTREVRVNVELTNGSEVGAAGNANGLKSSGVQTYVVTAIGDDSVGEDADDSAATFYVCDSTKDLKELGLHGNYDDTITFKQVNWTTSILLEGDGYANWGEAPKSFGNPNSSNIGNVKVEFFTDGAPAVININNGGVALGNTSTGGDRPLFVAGIDILNADSVAINVEDGDAVIDSLGVIAGDADGFQTLTIDAVGDVTINDALPNTLSSIDASDVDGVFTAALTDFGGEGAAELDFVGSEGGVTLTLTNVNLAAGSTLDGGAEGATLIIMGDDDPANNGMDDLVITDLSAAALTNINTIHIAEDDVQLTLAFDQLIDIGVDNLTIEDGIDAQLNISGLGEDPFVAPDVADGIAIGWVIVDAETTVTLDPDTDLTNIAGLLVPAGTTLNLTAEQFQQLGDGEIEGVDAATAFTVNITNLTQADIDIDKDGNGVADGIDLTGITADTITVALGESVDLNAVTDLNGASVIMDDDQILGLATEDQADDLVVSGGTNTTVQFNFTALADIEEPINAGGYDIDTLRVDDELVMDQNVEYIFNDLDSSVLVVITDLITGVDPTNRRVEIEPGVTVNGELVFNDINIAREVVTLTLTLDGDSHVTDLLRLPTIDHDGLNAAYFDTLTINSVGDLPNSLDNINALAAGPNPDLAVDVPEVQNNLLNVVINGTQDLEVGTITFSAIVDNDDATANLTVNSSADVVIEGVNFADAEVDHFVVTQTSTGTLTLTLDAADDDLGDELTITGSATGTLNIVIAEDNAVDLSEATLTNVDSILLTTGDDDVDRTELTLTIDQITDIGIANITVSDVDDDAILNVADYDGSEFDFGALEGNGIDVGTVTFAAGDDIVVDADTDFTGVDAFIVPARTNVVISAEQFEQLVASGALITTEDGGDPENEGTVRVDLNGDLTIDEDAETTINGSDITFVMANGEILNVDDFSLADGLQVEGDEAAAVKPLVNFTFGSSAGEVGASTNDTIDVADYQEVDLRILDTLLDQFTIGGVNSQSLEDLLENFADANILNIYQVEVDEELDPRDRVVVVESLAAPDGIEFSAVGALADYVRSIDLTLEADADNAAVINGDIIVNDGQVAAGYTMLTINADDTDGAAVDPVTINGDIHSVAAGAGDPGELLTVTINAGHDIVIDGTITFNSADAEGDAEATLTLTGAGDITVNALDFSDPQIDTHHIVNNATGVVNVPGASPAINMADAGVHGVSGDDQNNELVITGTGDSMTFGTSDDPATLLVDESNSGIAVNDLESIDASGYAGDLDLGIITGAVAEDASLTITGSDGITTLTLGAANDNDSNDLVAEAVFTMDDQADVTIDLSGSAAGSQIVITEDAVFPDMSVPAVADAGSLTIAGDLVIEGIVDFRELVDADGDSKLDMSGVTGFTINEGGAMLLTDDQWDALSAAQQADFAGEGLTLNLIDGDADLIDGANDDVIDLTDVRGVTVIQIDEDLVDDLRLTVAQAALVTTGNFDVNGVFTPSTWDDDDNNGTAEVDTEAGNLIKYDGDVFIYADGAAQDVSDLEIDGANGDRILLTINDPADVDTELTVRHEANTNDTLFDQVSYLDTAAEADGTPDAATAAAILAEITSLTVDVEVDTGNTDVEGNPIMVDSSFEFTNDTLTIDVEGNAAAIGTAIRDENGTEINDLLDEADTVLWQFVGTTASVEVADLVADDLVATDADDTFEYAANVDADNPIYIGEFDDDGNDLIDLTALGAAAVVQIGAGTVTDTVDATPTIYVTTNNAATTDFNTTNDDNDDVVDFTDLDQVATWLSDTTNAGLVLSNTANQENFVVLNDGTDSYIYHITDAGGDTDVDAGELQLIGVVDKVLVAADFTVA